MYAVFSHQRIYSLSVCMVCNFAFHMHDKQPETNAHIKPLTKRSQCDLALWICIIAVKYAKRGE